MRGFLCSLILCFVLCLQTLQAQSGPAVHKKWEFSFFGGLSELGENTALTPVQGQEQLREVGISYATGYALGARVTENLGQHLGAELEYVFANQPLRFRNLSPSLPTLNLDHRAHKLSYSILYYLSDRTRRIRPFASVGAGATFYQITGEGNAEALNRGVDLRDRWKFAFSFGAGVKFLSSENWGLRADFRDQVTGTPSYGLPAASPVVSGRIEEGFRPDGVQHNWHLGLGFFYSWDRR